MRIEWARSADQELWEDQRLRVKVLNKAGAKKLSRIIDTLEATRSLRELIKYPRHKFERLSGDLTGLCSMRMTGRDRVVFEIIESAGTIRILSVGGHYGD